MDTHGGAFHGHGVVGEGEKRHVLFRDVWYPENDVLAVIDDRDDATRAVIGFTNAGWHAEDILVLSGEAVEERLDATGAHCHLIGHLLRTLWSVSTTEGLLFRDYQEEARQGHSIIAVHTHEGKNLEEAREVLSQHGARRIEFFGHSGFVSTMSEEQATAS